MLSSSLQTPLPKFKGVKIIDVFLNFITDAIKIGHLLANYFTTGAYATWEGCKLFC